MLTIAESRRLCVAGFSGHVILFKFKKQESLSDILVLEIPITYENTDETDVSPECEFIPRSLPKQPDSTENEKKVCLYEILIIYKFFIPFSSLPFTYFNTRVCIYDMNIMKNINRTMVC